MIEQLKLKALEIVTSSVIPDPTAQRPPGFGAVDTVLGWMMWVSFAVAVGAMIIAGARIGLNNRNNGSQDAVESVGKILVGVLIASSASTIVTFLLGLAS